MNHSDFSSQEIQAYERVRDARRSDAASHAKTATVCAGKAVYMASGALGLLSIIEPQLANTVHQALGFFCERVGL